MNILLVNLILYTAENRIIPKRKSIKDCLICNYANGFVKEGHKVTIIASEDFKPTEDEKYAFDIIFMKSWMPSVFKPDRLPYPKQLRSYLKSNIDKFDIVISSEMFSMSSFLSAGICKGKLIVWQEMAIHQQTFFKLPSLIWHKCVIPLFMRKVRVVARTDNAQKFISEYCKQVSKDIVRHGANDEVFFPDDLSEDYFIIVSRLDDRKNVKYSISQFAKFLKIPRFNHYKLHIIGYGVLEKELKQQVKDLSLFDNVSFLGRMSHEELALKLRHAKALLISTKRDNSLLSVNEAISSGTPLISNLAPDDMDFINDNHLGIARDGWDETDLVKIADDYESYHQACVTHRDEMTNTGCARKIINIFNNFETL